MSRFKHDVTWDDMYQFGLWCEGCDQNLLADRDDLSEHGWHSEQGGPGWVLEHLQAIAAIHDEKCPAQQ